MNRRLSCPIGLPFVWSNPAQIRCSVGAPTPVRPRTAVRPWLHSFYASAAQLCNPSAALPCPIWRAESVTTGLLQGCYPSGFRGLGLGLHPGCPFPWLKFLPLTPCNLSIRPRNRCAESSEGRR
jgi:hypothetical protein